MEHLSAQVEHQQIEWRRAKVLDLSSQGRNQREIADIIHVGVGTVNRDLAHLNKQAQDNLKTHIQERLPEQYQKCINGLTQVLKMAWNIVLIDTSSGNNTTRLQALSLISDCYKYQMDLTTGSAIITDAIKYVQGKMDHLNNQEKKLLQDIKEEAEAEAEDNGLSNNFEREEEQQQQTHNGIF